MKANELRIGNLVKNNESRYGDKILVIESIGDNDTVNVFFREYPINALEGIQLTEEWLFKFGFECVFTYDDYHYYLESIDLGLDRSYQPFGIVEYKVEFKYVHQLQNLCFALTGEELTFKSE